MERKSGRNIPRARRSISAHGFRAVIGNVGDNQAQQRADQEQQAGVAEGEAVHGSPPKCCSRSLAVSSQERALDDLAALLQHDDAIGMLEREMHVVQGEHEGLVPALQERQHIGALHPVERRYGLVADQDRAAVVERARHRGALLLPAGQRAGLRENLVGEVDAGEDGAHLGHVARCRPHEGAKVVGRRVAIEPAHVDVVEHRQRLDERRGLRHQRHFGRALGIEQAEKRRLAGTAASHHGDALAGPHREVDVEKHRPAIVAGARPLQLEHACPLGHGAETCLCRSSSR